MEHETSVLAGRLWRVAVDEYLGSRSSKFATFEPEQLKRLREALLILVQPVPGMGVFIATRLRASVQSAAQQLAKQHTAMREWLDEAERHHVHEVLKIRDRMYQQMPKPVTTANQAGAPVPTPRDIADTLQEVQQDARVPKARETTPSMEEAADAFEAGIDDILDDENEDTPTNVVIDVEEDPDPRRH